MKFHDELNQKLFNKEELKPEVKEKLKEIAEAFIDYLEVNKDAIKDVVITGSSVSYNYTKYSDIDLHLKVDYDLIHEDCPIVEGYLWACKSTFNKDHDITIYGIPVEVYAESIEEDTVHNGLYSLWQDKWIDKPNKIPPTDNDSAVLSKYNELKEAADRLQDSEVASELIDKIYQMRKAGLQEAGEFSTENLAFKKLRDEGIIERLREMKKQKIDKELSLESYNESDNDLTNFCIIIDGDYNWLEEYGTFKSCKAAQEWLDKNGEEGWMYSQLTKGEMKDLGIDKYGHVNESIKESEEKLKVGDIVFLKFTPKFMRRPGKITKFISDDVVEIEFDQYKNNMARTDRYYIQDVEKCSENIEELPQEIEYEFEDGTKEERPSLDFKKVNESEDKLDYEQFKIAKSNFGTYFVTPYDSRIGRIEGNSAVTVSNKLAAAINKYNSKSIAAERKALINKLHKLFKQAGIPKMQDMKSSIRGYRPITQNGYYIEIYKGDYTTFNIGITGNREELGNKIKEILDNEGVKYTGSVDYFTVDMEKQDNKNESIKESEETEFVENPKELNPKYKEGDYVCFYDSYNQTNRIGKITRINVSEIPGDPILYYTSYQIEYYIPKHVKLSWGSKSSGQFYYAQRVAETNILNLVSEEDYQKSFSDNISQSNDTETDSVAEYVFDVEYEDTQADEWGDGFTSGTLTITKWSDGTYSWYADDIDDGDEGLKSIAQCKKAYKDYLKEGGFTKIVITQNKSIKESQEELIKEANKITNHGMLYMPVRKLAAKLMDRVKGTSDEEALKVAKMFFKETKNESIKEKLEEKEYQGCKYTILPDGKYCSIKIYAPKGYTFKNGDTWYSTETELKKADKKAKDIIDNEIELKESINKLEETLKKATDMEINEGMWASPFTIENAKQVAELLSKPITYEELNSEEGKQKYWNIIGADEFWDNVADEAFDIPEADARYLIVKFLEDWIETKENFNPDAYSQKAEDIIKKAIFMFNGITEDMGKSIKEDRLFKKQLTPLPSKDAKLNKGDKVTIDGQNGEIIEVKPMKMSDTCTYKIKLDNGKVIWRYEEEIINEEVKTSSLQKTISRALAESEGIYKPSLIYAAYKLEQQWLKSLGLGQDEQAPEIMLFVINNPEEGIEDTKLVKREDVYTYTPEQNEYYLDMTRDSGDVITDYNLEPAAKLVDSWNLKEDAQTLTDKVDKAEQELQDIIKMVKVGYQEDNKLINNLNKLINEALEK